MYNDHGYWNSYIIIIILLWVLLSIFISIDATKRGYNGILWGLVVLLMPMMGLLIYLIFISLDNRDDRRRNNSRRNLTKDNRNVSKQGGNTNSSTTFNYCSNCGENLETKNKYCNNCGLLVQE